ncbi:hypothetical protein ABH922_002216 [Rhodococcus sp. 27YEA15]|uniref:DUF4926 domain-containing protein n=1 Tax=Rhodococcus sp. 27YEA15 TaxID=3156259 RepID=UPI003C7B7691
MIREHSLPDTGFRVLGVVELACNLPDHGLSAWDRGTIVGVYPTGAFEVEFIDAAGRTVAVVTLESEQLRATRKQSCRRRQRRWGQGILGFAKKAMTEVDENSYWPTDKSIFPAHLDDSGEGAEEPAVGPSTLFFLRSMSA